MASRGGERRTGRGKADRTPGGKRGGGGAGVRTSRGKATSSATRRLKRVATAVGEAGGPTPEVPQRENDARREDARAHGGGAPVASAQPAEVGTRAASRWSSTPTGVRLSLDALTVDVAQAEIERGELKAVVSVRRGDELVYSERVNFDWSGGRDKFLRKSARALATAGVATHITEALLAEMRTALRGRAAELKAKADAPARR